MAELKEKFGTRLRILRTMRGMTQEDLAQAASISVDFLSLIERGRNSPSFTSLEKIAQSLRIPVKELFDFDENQNNDRYRIA